MFGGLARVVLPRGNGAFSGGSIRERVLRGPARKGNKTVRRAGGGHPPCSQHIKTSIDCFAHNFSLSTTTLLSCAAEHRDRGGQQHSTSPMFPAVPLCWLPCLVIVITADPTLLEAM